MACEAVDGIFLDGSGRNKLTSGIECMYSAYVSESFMSECISWMWYAQTAPDALVSGELVLARGR